MACGSRMGGPRLTRHLVIGTRGSRLALIQAQTVREILRKAFPNLTTELREITTRGDRIKARPSGETGPMGLFTREIERKLLEGEIDLAVHSLKDLPTELPEGLTIAATPERADAHDALVCREAAGLAELPEGAVVGTGSPRRAAQLLAARPDLAIRPLRGNVDTRLAKLSRGEYDAIVVAKAALDRMGRTDAASCVLDYETCLPAPGQGALAVEARDGDLEVMQFAGVLNHTETYVATAAERELLRRLGGGCHLPMGALGECDGGVLTLRAALFSPDGRRSVRARARGSLENPSDLVDNCTKELSRLGAAELIP